MARVEIPYPSSRGSPRPLAGSGHVAFTLSMAAAEPTVSILPLRFGVREFRGPATRVAAVAPSLAPLRSETSLKDKPLVVVWGEGGGAALTLTGQEIRSIDLGPSAGDLATTEGGRDAIPASRVEALPFSA